MWIATLKVSIVITAPHPTVLYRVNAGENLSLMVSPTIGSTSYIIIYHCQPILETNSLLGPLGIPSKHNMAQSYVWDSQFVFELDNSSSTISALFGLENKHPSIVHHSTSLSSEYNLCNLKIFLMCSHIFSSKIRIHFYC